MRSWVGAVSIPHANEPKRPVPMKRMQSCLQNLIVSRLGAILLIASTSGGVIGCEHISQANDFAYYRQPSSDLRKITTLSVEELSTTRPAPIDEVSLEFKEARPESPIAAETMKLDIADVRAAAIVNNLDLQVELVEPSIAEETIYEQEAAFEPSITAGFRREKTNRETTIDSDSSINVLRTDIDFGVNLPLRSGGSVNIDFLASQSNDSTFESTADTRKAGIINPTYESALSFSIAHPLLRDNGVRTNTHQIRVARIERDLTSARTRLAVIRVLSEADRAYWRFYSVRRELQVRQEQYERAVEQLGQARRRVAAGAAPKIEIMRAEAGVANRLEAIIVADTERRRVERELKRIMNSDRLPMNSATSIIPSTDPLPLGLSLAPETLVASALENRMELLEIELQRAIDASQIDVEENGLLPELNLQYGMTLNGFGASFNDSSRRAADGSFADYSIGLVANIPVGNTAAKARLNRARLRRVRRIATSEQRRLTIEQEVYDAVDQFDQAWQRILAARQEVILAARTYEAEKRQFEVGARTSVEVLEAADFLAAAESREVRALASYEIAKVDIALATGTLLGEDGVVWDATTLP